MAELDRQTLIDLLNRFDDTDDAAVAAAAREAQQALTEAGLSWDDVLVPADVEADDEDEDEDEGEYEEYEADDEVDDADDDDAGGDADNVIPISAGEAREDLALIDRILRDHDVSEDTREELEGYREDIEAGEFTASDRNYLKALKKRLSK